MLGYKYHFNHLTNEIFFRLGVASARLHLGSESLQPTNDFVVLQSVRYGLWLIFRIFVDTESGTMLSNEPTFLSCARLIVICKLIALVGLVHKETVLGRRVEGTYDVGNNSLSW